MKKEPVRWLGRVEKVTFPNRGTVIPVERNEHSVSSTVFSSPADAAHCEKTSTPALRPAHVKNALPGQLIEVSQSSHQFKRREANVLRLVERAPYETDPACPHAQFCGGCLYQTVPYAAQLVWKNDFIHELLEPVCSAFPAEVFQPIKPSPLQFGYRNKMEFSFGDEFKGGPLTLGLHKKGSFHDIVPVPDCALVHPDIQAVLTFTQQYFRDKETPFYRTISHEGYLRHLVVRRSFAEEKLLINLVTTSESVPDPDLTGYARQLLNVVPQGHIAGILHTFNDSLADVVQSDKTEVLWGDPFLHETLCGLNFELSPFSFFQTNSKGAEILYQTVVDLAAQAFSAEGSSLQDKTVFDLYCGTGTIAQLMAHAGAGRVFGIEIIEEAVEAARVNACRNHLENCSFQAGDVLKLVDTLESKPDLIILDPPRDGIHPKALPKILAFAPRHFIYVSCKPTSLVRDLPWFFEAGYDLKAIVPVDMFPGTVHVETVCLLVLRNPVTHVNIDVDVEELVQNKRGQATYP